MNTELAQEQLRDIEEIRMLINRALLSSKFHRSGVTTRLLILRETIQKAKRESEVLHREAFNL